MKHRTFMRALALFAILVPGAGGAVTTDKPSRDDEGAIKQLQSDFVNAWNKHDSKAMTAVFDDDADLINPQGRHARGREQIERLFRDEHASALKDTKFQSR